MMARNNGIIAIRRVGYLSSTSSLSTLIPNYNNHNHIRNFHSNNNCRYIHSHQHQNQQQHAIYRSPSSGSSLYFSSTAAPDDNNSGPGGVRGWMNDRRDR